MSVSDDPSRDPRVNADGLDALITGARKLAQGEDYQTAVGQLELALDIAPENTEVLELLAAVRETLAARPKELRIEKLLTQAQAHFEQGDTGKARAIAEQIVGIDNDHQAALDLLFRCYAGDDSPPDQSFEPPPLPPESQPSEDSLRLIVKIEQLLSRPAGSDPATAAAALQITARPEEGDLDGAPLARESQEFHDPSAEVNAGLETQRQEQERSRSTAKIQRLLDDARFDEAQRRLAEAEAIWGKTSELAELKSRLDRSQRERREAKALLSEAQRLYQAGNYEEALAVLAQALSVDPNSQELAELQDLVRKASEPEAGLPVPPLRPRTGRVRRFRAMALVLLGLLITLAIGLGGRKDEDRQHATASPLGTGAIKVILPSPGYTVLDNDELPEEGRNLTRIHHFQNVPTGSHKVTIWRPGNPERKNRYVSVEAGETTEYRE